MDLDPTDDQQAVIDLAARICDDLSNADRLRTLEQAGAHHHDELWTALAAADLIGLTLPEADGGAGFGLVEAALVAEVLGRHVAPVPYLEVVAAGRALARAGHSLAERVAAGSIVVPALREGPDAAEVRVPSTTAVADGDTWRIEGTKRLISGGAVADHFVVSATIDGTAGRVPALFVVSAEGLPSTDSVSTAGQILRSVELDGVTATRVDGDGQTSLAHELRVLRCALLAGISDGALQLTARHASDRHQFGSPIGTFQAVAHRLADAWLDVTIVTNTARQAAWRTDNDLPAEQATASAALWACEGSQRVVHAAQHVHGGIGVDLDYPVHRYFRWAKDVELQLGGAGRAARDLGDAVASEPLTIG